MASMRDIKRRRESIESTEQITKAMKLVATVKLQKARTRAEQSKPYALRMYSTVSAILKMSTGIRHRYLEEHEGGKAAVVLITGNRGLAGGYNQNVIRLVTSEGFTPENSVIYTLGRKGREYFGARGYTLSDDWSDVINEPLYKDAIQLTSVLLEAFTAGEISSIYLVYTEFKNTVSHIPHLIRLLPVSEVETSVDIEIPEDLPMNFEPDDTEVLDEIIPQYLASLFYGAMLQSVASENGARMSAMDAATDNAEEMIDRLSLEYNRARQGAITQELTEIIAGSQAVS